MKIQTSGDQMIIKTGGITQLVLGIVFVLVGVFTAALPFIGITSNNGEKVPAWVSLFGLAFLAVGIYLLLSAKNRAISLVKNGQSNVTEKKLLGGGVKSQNFQTSVIVAVDLSTRNETESSGANDRSTTERRSDLKLILNDNSTVDVTSSASRGGFNLNGVDMTNIVRKAPLSREAEQIAAFLGVPVKYEDASSMQGLRDLITGGNQTPNTPPTINPNAPPQNNPTFPENKQNDL